MLFVNFITITIAVALGVILSSLISLAIIMNKRFMTWYVGKIIDMTKVVTEEMEELY